MDLEQAVDGLEAVLDGRAVKSRGAQVSPLLRKMLVGSERQFRGVGKGLLVELCRRVGREMSRRYVCRGAGLGRVTVWRVR